ncbi:nuclear pore complex protein Nup85-like isoform X2 [Prorops nasuta]|uniref:nuclear pore complex protein Nup85-like isoform X2 n=1 Tax=Prorops nasuta TaxID=863751 RepID=UPI0034CF079E
MADIDQPPLIGIPDELCEQIGITAAWSNANRFSVSAYKHTNKLKDTKNSIYLNKTKVHYFLRPEIILFSQPLRKLVNESNGVFLSIQKIKTSGDVRLEILKQSKRYRSILRACIENLEEILTKSLPEETNELENYITIFYSVEFIWHLTEILYLDVIPGDVILPKFLKWIRFHFPRNEKAAEFILAQQIIGADLENINYWKTVLGCALHGDLEIVCALLEQHHRSDHPGFNNAISILRRMPVYDVYGGYSMNEFTAHFKQWQMDLKSNLDTKAYAIDRNLEVLMKLVSGDETILWELAEYTEAWFELLAAKLIYSVPCCKLHELSNHANKVAEKWQASSGKLNIQDKNQIKVSKQLHESLLLEYGTTLMCHHSLWQCGASYLMHCEKQGKARLEILLPSLPMGSESRISKIIDIAKDNNMNHIVTSICKIQGIKCIKRGRMGNALTWALKAQDNGFITYIADQFLRHYADNGELECRDLLENLGSCMLASERLTFLGKYCEFHQKYENGEFKDAASLLVALLVSNLTPKYFWPILLTDVIPLLEAEDVLLSSNDSFELLRCMEAYGNNPKFEEKADIFRLAVARNLARALNLEGSQE